MFSKAKKIIMEKSFGLLSVMWLCLYVFSIDFIPLQLWQIFGHQHTYPDHIDDYYSPDSLKKANKHITLSTWITHSLQVLYKNSDLLIRFYAFLLMLANFSKKLCYSKCSLVCTYCFPILNIEVTRDWHYHNGVKTLMWKDLFNAFFFSWDIFETFILWISYCKSENWRKSIKMQKDFQPIICNLSSLILN